MGRSSTTFYLSQPGRALETGEEGKKLFQFIYLFCKRERDTTCVTGERQTEGERENFKQAPNSQHSDWRWAQSHELWDHDLSQDQESNTKPTEPPTHPRRGKLLKKTKGHLGGSLVESHGIEPHVMLRTEHGTCLRFSLPLLLSPAPALSLSLKEKKRKNFCLLNKSCKQTNSAKERTK